MKLLRHFSILLAAVSALDHSAPARLQGQPDTGPGADQLTPMLVIAGAREAHREGPAADEVTIRFSSNQSQSRVATARLAWDASDADAAPRFRIEFDSSSGAPTLIISAQDGMLAAANSANENDRWIAPGAFDLDDTLGLLPPIPLPQLRLAFGQTNRWNEPLPYTPDTVWDTAEVTPPTPLAPSERITLRGRSPAGQVTAVFDAASLRLRGLTAELGGGQVIELTSAPVDPGSPASWIIAIDGRTSVPRLRDLSPQRRPVPPGHFISDFTDNTGWSLHAALDALPSGPRAADPGDLTPDPTPDPTPAVALVLFRTPEDPISLAACEASARLALQALRAAFPSATQPPRPHLIASIDLAIAQAGSAALQRRWQGDGAQVPGWATPAASIDRLTLNGNAVLALIAADRRLLAVFALDDETADSLTEKVREALTPAD